ncbi:methanethiol S-methyltransferase [Blastopirellula marina]|uniref:methanethiol S-methyltransferase n=1 Tax=Blastopirellula marina TaxID=124 RepID=A0A2S8F7N3_9BACT|nr:methanethiol S-methyltransferase [Blastopirellula marina]PQO28172.1 hypothetical protein C5Y98_25040 [Blastopirellula marina]PTL41712.1 isoprenylcysteine carboxylmethyltransferase family protein [Blastopirellula marina]
MFRILSLVYAIFAYVMFLAIMGYFLFFLAGGVVPITVDTPSQHSLAVAIGIDLGLILLFAVQHSVMARPAFKRVWTKIVPAPLERATYVYASNVVMIVLILFWQGIDITLWNVQQPIVRTFLWGLYLVGFLMVPVVSLMINHFDLFGLRQVWLHLKDQEYRPLPFRTPLLYAIVRHPLYLAWGAAFWITPTMTAGHLLLAVGMTVYMGVAAVIEERDLVGVYGDQYRQYQKEVPMFVPRLTGPLEPEGTS